MHTSCPHLVVFGGLPAPVSCWLPVLYCNSMGGRLLTPYAAHIAVCAPRVCLHACAGHCADIVYHQRVFYCCNTLGGFIVVCSFPSLQTNPDVLCQALHQAPSERVHGGLTVGHVKGASDVRHVLCINKDGVL